MKTFAIANVVRVDVITEEDVPETYSFIDMADEITAEALISEGEEEELRVGNIIHAINATEDIAKGYDLNIKQALLSPELLALVDGGEWDDIAEEYNGIEAGLPVKRTLFTTKIYTEEKDESGATVSYLVFTLKHCKGSPVNYTFKNGEFFVPEMKVTARAKKKEKLINFKKIDELP